MRIGFIGLGVMGSGMVKNLMKHGYEVYGFTRTKAKAEPLIKDGMHYDEDRQHLAQNSDVVITMVGFPQDVEDIYLSEDGLLNNMKEGTYVIDMTTSSPDLAMKIYEAAKKKGIHALDAPVSGGDSGAQAGTLSIMVGGDQADFEAMHPLFEAMGSTIIHEGTAGFGQHTKMANQIAIAGTLAGTAEAISYAKAAGLDLNLMMDTITKGAAGSWQLENLGRKMLADDYNPGFYIKHFIKDMKIADQEALSRHLTLKVLETVLSMDESLKERYGDLGTQALIKYYEDKQ
ncbi:NAD(P)-dependent oxidoreductase [Intestinibaculum porci]|uniref:NAD(P)-dependent oxidoreductase n=1 Tax=Intestinibaculum porci TaxID=2487118 RepID=UPI002409536C|nr:NAD(P)-dependent oxidoreductase [Intestinibaculum porci]MDD6348927.1 NAD(P)-dependent oxidoreductase [Intestinibaculum porci]MDD6422946.1 NAD(P)-dependent oxidoreductase [Intestinibaculum porci]